eukprot:545606_1
MRLQLPNYCNIKKVLCTDTITFILCPVMNDSDTIKVKSWREMRTFRSRKIDEWNNKDLIEFIESIKWYMNSNVFTTIYNKIINDSLTGKDIAKFQQWGHDGRNGWGSSLSFFEIDLVDKFFGLKIDKNEEEKQNNIKRSNRGRVAIDGATAFFCSVLEKHAKKKMFRSQALATGPARYEYVS